jgi:hypothetical protein
MFPCEGRGPDSVRSADMHAAACDFCRMCQRQVHDLTGMTRAERTAFVAGCGGEACVSYTVRLKPAVAAAALAASTAILVAPAPAMAQQRHKPRPPHVRTVKMPPQPVYYTAGMIMPLPPPEPRKPADVTPSEKPAAADRRLEPKPQ